MKRVAVIIGCIGFTLFAMDAYARSTQLGGCGTGIFGSHHFYDCKSYSGPGQLEALRERNHEY